MFRPQTLLTQPNLLLGPGNRQDSVLVQLQRHWIVEAIRYTHPEAVEHILSDGTGATDVNFPTVSRLPTQRTEHYNLDPLLENEGTVTGTYNVIEQIFSRQLGFGPDKHTNPLHLVYGDQKTVSLIHSVQRERAVATQSYDKYDWVLPVPGLFHWRTNLLEMIYDVYFGPGGTESQTTLNYQRAFLNNIIGDRSPFQQKEELAMRSFDARVTAAYYSFLPRRINKSHKEEVDVYMKRSGRVAFLHQVDRIREALFTIPAQRSPLESSPAAENFDYEYCNHAKFLQQMELYKTLKQAIKRADIGLIKRTFPRCALLFHGSKKRNYADLSCYMTWLTQTDAADVVLQDAVLANGLVNLRGQSDSWFEMDRLNEFFNLQMKNLMSARRTSSIDIHTLFQQTALSANYCTDLSDAMENVFGESPNPRHHNKNVTHDVRNLAFELSRSGSMVKNDTKRLDQQPDDIHRRGTNTIFDLVKRFNKRVVYKMLEEDDNNDYTTTNITQIENHTGPDDG